MNALGQTVTTTDRNGTVHTFAYDVLGRPVSDAVTQLGAGVDGSVRRIETAYDGQGNASLITSYDAADGGNAVNQVKQDFNGLGQLTSEWQEHDGAVTGSSLRVQYAYSFAPSGTANHSRPTSMTYPNGKVVNYAYAAGLSANISRLSSLAVGATTVEGYNYLGLGTVVERTHTGTGQPGVDLTYVKQGVEAHGEAGDQYRGLDRFGRIIDQRWRNTSDNSNRDRYEYTYDRNSNVTARTNVVNSAFNETYTYDGLGQLIGFSRGATTKSWDYDAVGNWDGVTTNGSTESRMHNRQNEIESVTGQTTPTYDPNGNQTRDFTGQLFTYDAWNRTKTAGDRTYEYDGLNRRIEQVVGTTTTDSYHTAAWQVAEERVNNTARQQYVWSPVYLDALVLRDRDANNDGTLEERLWVAQDATYNVTALIDSAGTVVERYAYDPYGAPTIFDASYGTRASSSYAWAHLFQGLLWDAGIGKYHARNRDYDPVQGRWTTEDPIGFAGGVANLYQAYRNSPGNYSDELGLADEKWKYKWHWHHMLPQSVFTDDFLKRHCLNINIHDKKWGLMLQGQWHIGEKGIHVAGWNEDWNKWIEEKEAAGHRISERDIRKQLDVMETDPKYAANLAKGRIPKKASYTEWRKYLDGRKAKLLAAMKAAKAAGRGKRVAQKLGKAVPGLSAVVSIAAFPGSAEAKGGLGASGNLVLDNVPVLSTVKAGWEIISGEDWIPDVEEDVYVDEEDEVVEPEGRGIWVTDSGSFSGSNYSGGDF